MKPSEKLYMLPDPQDDQRREARRGVWICGAAFFGLFGLTVISYTRPDWIQGALGGVTVIAFTFTAIGLQELWRLRRW